MTTPKNSSKLTHEEELFICKHYDGQLEKLKTSKVGAQTIIKARHQLISYYWSMCKENGYKAHPIPVLYNYIAELDRAYINHVLTRKYQKVC